jgi:hypothetical protein
MKKMLLSLLMLVSISCSKEDAKQDTNQLSLKLLQKVEGPTSANRSAQVTLNVFWYYSSGCDVFSKFEETRQGNVITIQSLGYYAEGICTMDAGVKTKPYTFVSSQSGVFELRFLNKDSSVISHFITVN